MQKDLNISCFLRKIKGIPLFYSGVGATKFYRRVAIFMVSIFFNFLITSSNCLVFCT